VGHPLSQGSNLGNHPVLGSPLPERSDAAGRSPTESARANTETPDRGRRLKGAIPDILFGRASDRACELKHPPVLLPYSAEIPVRLAPQIPFLDPLHLVWRLPFSHGPLTKSPAPVGTGGLLSRVGATKCCSQVWPLLSEHPPRRHWPVASWPPRFCSYQMGRRLRGRKRRTIQHSHADMKLERDQLDQVPIHKQPSQIHKFTPLRN